MLSVYSSNTTKVCHDFGQHTNHLRFATRCGSIHILYSQWGAKSFEKPHDRQVNGLKNQYTPIIDGSYSLNWEYVRLDFPFQTLIHIIITTLLMFKSLTLINSQCSILKFVFQLHPFQPHSMAMDQYLQCYMFGDEQHFYKLCWCLPG